VRRGVLITLVAIVVIGVVLLMHGAKVMEERMLAERDGILKVRIGDLRQAINVYHEREHRYPPSLQALVPADLRAIPLDPITHQADWRVITEETVTPNGDFTDSQSPRTQSAVIDVKSAAPGAGRDGVPYADY
jgi:type II secretory pathway pseudopilin PulG